MAITCQICTMPPHEKCSTIKLVKPNASSSVFSSNPVPEPKYPITTFVGS